MKFPFFNSFFKKNANRLELPESLLLKELKNTAKDNKISTMSERRIDCIIFLRSILDFLSGGLSKTYSFNSSILLAFVQSERPFVQIKSLLKIGPELISSSKV